MTDALLYDAFIQCLRLPLEVFKKICKCLGGVLFLFYLFFLNNLCYITVLYVVQCYVFFVGIYFECATWLIFIY